jgi:hypothetical protein
LNKDQAADVSFLKCMPDHFLMPRTFGLTMEYMSGIAQNDAEMEDSLGDFFIPLQAALTFSCFVAQ